MTTGHSASMKALPWSGGLVSTEFEALVLLHSFSALNCLIGKKPFSGHVLLITAHMVGFAVHTVVSAFVAFARAAVVGSMALLMALYLWTEHEMGEFEGLGSHSDGYASSNSALLSRPV